MCSSDIMLSSKSVDDSLALLLKRLPISVRRSEIITWFQKDSIKVKDVHLQLNARGKCKGKAIVVMQSLKDVEKGMKKHLQYMGREYIEVCKPDGGMLHQLHKKAEKQGHYVRLRPLPSDYSASDVVQFFNGFKVDDVFLIPSSKKNFQKAFVSFVSNEEAEKAMNKHKVCLKDKNKLPLWKVKISRCNKETWESARRIGGTRKPTLQAAIEEPSKLKDSESLPRNPKKRKVEEQPRRVLRIDGLLNSTRGERLLQWFQDDDIVVEKINLDLLNDRNTRGAFVLVHSEEDVKKAVEKDGSLLETRVIRVCRSNEQEMTSVAPALDLFKSEDVLRKPKNKTKPRKSKSPAVSKKKRKSKKSIGNRQS